MDITVKHFSELTPSELYEILRLRTQVFVVEQKCPYQEVDGKDLGAYHLYLSDDDGIQAYLRVLDKGVSFEDASIGRVFSLKRRQGLATLLMREGIRVAQERFGAERITIEAQVYARSLYEKLGFVRVSENRFEADVSGFSYHKTFITEE